MRKGKTTEGWSPGRFGDVLRDRLDDGGTRVKVKIGATLRNGGAPGAWG